MHKLFLWATYVASTVAMFDSLAPVQKRQNALGCEKTIATKDGEVCYVEVQVGNPGGNGSDALRFIPEDGEQLQNLPKGSIIQFNFMPKNHTVTESLFADPCVPLFKNQTAANTDRPGVHTGFVPVAANDTFTKAFRIRLNDTKPMWIYCGQLSHCQKGMVMVINQNASSPDKTLQNYRNAAAQVPLPGQSSSTTAAPAESTTAAVQPVSPATPTDATGTSPSSTDSSSAPVVSVFNGVAPSLTEPVKLAAMVWLGVAGIITLL